MDEFDLALTEALNEAVPPADFATNLADRLVTRTRRRARFWKTLFVLGMFSAAAGAVVTVTTLSSTEDSQLAATEISDAINCVPPESVAPGGSQLAATESDWESRHLGGDSTPTPSTLNPSTSQLLNISTPQQGAPQVQTTTIKKAAALTGAIALAAATPTRADGYQFIVSGYPAAHPSHSAVSSGTSLAVGPLGDVSAAAALEARARTCDDSDGIALRSDKYTAMIIIFK